MKKRILHSKMLWCIKRPCPDHKQALFITNYPLEDVESIPDSKENEDQNMVVGYISLGPLKRLGSGELIIHV